MKTATPKKMMPKHTLSKKPTSTKHCKIRYKINFFTKRTGWQRWRVIAKKSQKNTSKSALILICFSFTFLCFPLFFPYFPWLSLCFPLLSCTSVYFSLLLLYFPLRFVCFPSRAVTFLWEQMPQRHWTSPDRSQGCGPRKPTSVSKNEGGRLQNKQVATKMQVSPPLPLHPPPHSYRQTPGFTYKIPLRLTFWA